MAEKQRRKGSDVLCGLRSSTPSKPATTDRPSSSAGEHYEVSGEEETLQSEPGPAALTLPFQNRERMSHLISDEDLDRIMRADRENSLSQLPARVAGTWSNQGIRRTSLQADNLNTSQSFVRPRPASLNLSRMIAQATGNHIRTDLSRSTIARDPTLTALPRPPTKNDLAEYPAEDVTSYPGCSPNPVEYVENKGKSANIPRPRTPMPPPPTGPINRQQNTTQGHKRKLSISAAANNVVESIKKRIRRPETPSPASLRISSPMSFVTARDTPRPDGYPVFPQSAAYQNTVPIRIAGDMHVTFSNTDTSNDSRTIRNVASRASSYANPDKKGPSTKEALKNSWEATKDVAKATLDMVNPLPRIGRIKEPEFVEAYHPSRSVLSMRSPAVNEDEALSRATMDKIAGSSPVNPLPANPGTATYHPRKFTETELFRKTTATRSLDRMSHQQQMALTHPIPAPMPAPAPTPAQVPALPRLQPWETATRAVLGSEIRRLEGRTMDLLIENEQHKNQIEYLRAKVEHLEAGEASRRVGFVRAGAGEGEEEMEGVGEAGPAEVEDLDDKRKTWMTCDSE